MSHGRQRQLALATIVARELSPDSRLATARRLSPETATSSLGSLLGGLSGMALNQVRLPGQGNSQLTAVTKPTRIQQRAPDLLGVKPNRNVPMFVTGRSAAYQAIIHF